MYYGGRCTESTYKSTSPGFKGARTPEVQTPHPHLIDHVLGARITLILLLQAFSTKRILKNTIGRLDLPKMKR